MIGKEGQYALLCAIFREVPPTDIRRADDEGLTPFDDRYDAWEIRRVLHGVPTVDVYRLIENTYQFKFIERIVYLDT
jgi:hypothetical protein